jgi:RNA polymerase sigma factor (sigma-70 family)
MDELEALFQRAQQADLEAYGEIVRRFQDMAVGYAYAVLGDFHAAEDAAQEAFIEAYENLARVYSPAAFPSWLRRIVYKHCDRSTRGRRPATVSPDVLAETRSAEPDPSEVLEARELRDRVLAAVRALPEHERAGPDTERTVLERLDREDPELGEQVRLHMFTFGDIAVLPDQAIAIIVREVDTGELAVAMKGAQVEMVKAVRHLEETGKITVERKDCDPN